MRQSADLIARSRGVREVHLHQKVLAAYLEDKVQLVLI